MHIAFNKDQISFVRLELAAGEIPELLRKHAQRYPGTSGYEEQGAALIRNRFPPDDAKAFLEAVVRWGRGHRFVGRLLDQNDAIQITRALQEAHVLLRSGQTAAAVIRLQKLRYIGQSFASKITRFLSPYTAVILDDVLRSALGYRESQDGYEEFLRDCQTVLTRLISFHPQLRICDVEAAIFAKIQGY